VIITRHSGFPYLDNEILDGTTDLEVDLDQFYVGFNGNVDDSNIAPAAGLDGSKVAAETIASGKLIGASVNGSKIKEETLLNAKMAVGAVTAALIEPNMASSGAATPADPTVVPRYVTILSTATGTQWTEVARAAVLTGPSPTKVLVLYDCTISWFLTGQLETDLGFQFRLIRGSDSNVLFESEELAIPTWGTLGIGKWIQFPLSFHHLEESAPGDSSANYIIESRLTFTHPTNTKLQQWYDNNLVLLNLRR